jgi:hypothetical protein
VLSLKNVGVREGSQALRAEGVCAVYTRGDVFPRIDGLPGMSLLPCEVTTLGDHLAGIRVAADTIGVFCGLATNIPIPAIVMSGELSDAYRTVSHLLSPKVD